MSSAHMCLTHNRDVYLLLLQDENMVPARFVTAEAVGNPRLLQQAIVFLLVELYNKETRVYAAERQGSILRCFRSSENKIGPVVSEKSARNMLR